GSAPGRPRAVTAAPRAARTFTTCAPRKPPPPVTSTRIGPSVARNSSGFQSRRGLRRLGAARFAFPLLSPYNARRGGPAGARGGGRRAWVGGPTARAARRPSARSDRLGLDGRPHGRRPDRPPALLERIRPDRRRPLPALHLVDPLEPRRPARQLHVPV